MHEVASSIRVEGNWGSPRTQCDEAPEILNELDMLGRIVLAAAVTVCICKMASFGDFKVAPELKFSEQFRALCNITIEALIFLLAFPAARSTKPPRRISRCW